MDVKELVILENDSIKKALEALNKTGLGTLFVTTINNVLVGVITDGDIRRAILDNMDIAQEIKTIMNKNYTALPFGEENSVILDKINNVVKVIPLVDENNKLIDYASINKIRRISVASPLLNGNELAYVTECIKTNWISSQGKFVRQFEDLFSKHHNGFRSLAVSNGTVALHLALESLGITEGDEVLVPDLTFAASVNAIIYTGATPVLVDIDIDTWNINVEILEKYITPKTKAIMPVHLYGHPCDMDAVMNFANKHNLLVIEDCAEALGSYYKGQPVGTFGDVATFSFYGNKTITTGEGGMIIYKDDVIADKGATLRDHGMDKNRRYWHSQIGYNYRLTNLQAAIGVAQYERLEEFVSAKRHIAENYNKVLSSSKYFVIPAEKPDCINSYWLYTFLVKSNPHFTREDLMEHLNRNGVETRPVFFPMHIMPPYIQYGNTEELVISKLVSDQGMSLPSSVNLTEVEIAHICSEIKKFCQKFN